MNGRYSLDPQKTQQAVAKANESLSVQSSLLTWCAVHGALQLAIRHPEFPPITRQLIEPFIEQLGRALVSNGFFTGETLRESIELEQRFHARRVDEG